MSRAQLFETRELKGGRGDGVQSEKVEFDERKLVNAEVEFRQLVINWIQEMKD